MQISQNGLNFIKSWEKLRLTSYKDSGGVWTIGYGATTYENGAKVMSGQTITAAKAAQLLNYHVGVAVAAVSSRIKVPLAQGQFDALVSFAYNLGAGAFTKSTLAVRVSTNPNDLAAIEAEFKKWVYDNGEVVDGLVNRRNAEIALYKSETKKKASSSGSLSQSRS